MTTRPQLRARRLPVLVLAPCLALLGMALAPRADAATLEISFGLTPGSSVNFFNGVTSGSGTLASGQLNVQYMGTLTGSYFLATQLQVNTFAAQVTNVSAPVSLIPLVPNASVTMSLGGPGAGYAIALTSPLTFFAYGFASLSGTANFGTGQFIFASGTAPAAGALSFFAFGSFGSLFASVNAYGAGVISPNLNVTLYAESQEINARLVQEAVPEPTSIALFGLGALLVGGHVARRWTRRG